jgi:hypothetical protein
MEYMTDRLFSWMSYEPFIGILMIISAAVLFISHFNKDRFKPANFWQWFGRIVESLSVALAFLFLLWAFRAVLNSNNEGFSYSHGRVSEANYNSVQTIWGSPHHQQELMVTINAEREVEEEYDQNADGEPLYHMVRKEIPIEGLNPITSSNGKALLNLNERKKGTAYYEGYDLKFNVTYSVVNPLDEPTTVNFLFLLPEQVMYDSLRVSEGGKDMSGKYSVSYEGISWERPFAPKESTTVQISYLSRGLDNFYYVVSQPREINNFDFMIVVNHLDQKDVNYPENCLTPQEITNTPDQKGVQLRWHLNNAVTTSGMGIELPQSEQPGAKVSLVLINSPYALMLLITSICLTLLILGQKVNFLEISLLSALYCLLFFTMASLSDYLVGFWGSLVIGGILTLFLTFLLYRKAASTFLRNSILVMVAFFTFVYPLCGLFPEIEADFKNWVMIALIIYIFFISLRSRIIRKAAAPAEDSAQGKM